MLSLIAKDFKLLFGLKGSKLSRILSVLFSVLAVCIFIFLEVSIFNSILNKIKSYSGASEAYLSIFLFVIMVLLCFYCLFVSKKLFFNEKDLSQLKPFPISNTKIVCSKLVLLFLIMYFFNLLFTLPIFISYGITYGKMLFYFYGTIYYPVFIFFFQAGVSFILLLPFKTLSDFLKKHLLIQLVLVIIIGLGFCFAYGNILSLFVKMVSSNKNSTLFTKSTMDAVRNVSKNLFPINFLVQIFVRNKSISFLLYFTFGTGIFIIGCAILVYFYNRFTFTNNEVSKKKEKEKNVKVHSITYSLIKKEFINLFRNSNFILTFTGLLFIEPFLNYYVVQALNTIFKSGTLAYFSIIAPNIVTALDYLIVLLIVAIVASGGTSFITNEKNSLRIIKTIPVSIKKQLKIKILIPFISVSIFAFFSILTLMTSNQMKFVPGLFCFIISLLFLMLLLLVALYEELHISRSGNRSTFYSNLVIYLIPLFIFFLMLVCSIYRVNVYLVYFIVIAFIALCYLPFLIKGKTRFYKWFLDMEVIN